MLTSFFYSSPDYIHLVSLFRGIQSAAPQYSSANMSGQSLHPDQSLGEKYVRSTFPVSSNQFETGLRICPNIILNLWSKCQIFYLHIPKSENGLLGEMLKSVIKHFQREDILNENDNSCLVNELSWKLLGVVKMYTPTRTAPEYGIRMGWNVVLGSWEKDSCQFPFTWLNSSSWLYLGGLYLMGWKMV